MWSGNPGYDSAMAIPWLSDRRSFADNVESARLALDNPRLPDTTIQPPQWFARTRYTHPIERLAIALIESALRDYRLAKHRKSATEWLQSEDDSPFSLRWTCDLLGIDFCYAQRRLLTYLSRSSTKACAVMSLIAGG
jgi:hypothetical protein